jgi:hypothetical protein
MTNETNETSQGNMPPERPDPLTCRSLYHPFTGTVYIPATHAFIVPRSSHAIVDRLYPLSISTPATEDAQLSFPTPQTCPALHAMTRAWTLTLEMETCQFPGQ